jgi:hypothetical protein
MIQKYKKIVTWDKDANWDSLYIWFIMLLISIISYIFSFIDYSSPIFMRVFLNVFGVSVFILAIISFEEFRAKGRKVFYIKERRKRKC